ncbi:hypothetical protein SADUNF_Sadunf05G0012100 [Salix dunnii]|uniref:Uncharacterized protein n=1 Tax=Salix dunnii TaxID=1413687 RepID=A0A835KAX4_9ROSI|nr:hypothetical protein SADUNF_Sadunf05G0012100 [Salix dunnii]
MLPFGLINVNDGDQIDRFKDGTVWNSNAPIVLNVNCGNKEKDRSKSHHHKRQKQKAKEKQQDERNSSPVQLSKFLGRDKEDGVRRSAVSGKKILLKLEKSKEDKAAENKRNELLKFLNASCD